MDFLKALLIKQKTVISMTLTNYNDFSEKDRWFNRIQIDTEKDFDTIYNILRNHKSLCYRAVEEAKYRNYTSIQRSWILQDEKLEKLRENESIINYDDYVGSILNRAYTSPDVKQFFAENNIPHNHPVLWAMLQHYGYPTPFLDFSYSIDDSLFFLIPNAGQLPLPPFQPNNSIDDYFSVYVYNGDVDWFKASIQNITYNGAGKVEEMLRVVNFPVDTSDYKAKTDKLDYSDFSQLPFVTVDGPAMGVQQCAVPVLRFQTSCDMSIPRTSVQDGLFMCIPAVSPVMEEVIVNHTKEKLITCIDIHKSVRQHIVDNILIPNNINVNSMYMPNDPTTLKIKQILKKALGF